MNDLIHGIHHITAISGDPQKNVDFYLQVLGLRLVKKTVNFDDPHTYHLYYGDETGTPGSVLTFFPWTEQGFKGRKGSGQVTAISFSVPNASIDYWVERLNKHNIEFAGPLKRFDEQVLIFEDYDGFELEIVASEEEARDGWQLSDVPAKHSIRGFFGAAISHQESAPTENMIGSHLSFLKTKQNENRTRYTMGKGGPGTYLDILTLPDYLKGTMGVGAVHHIAFRTENDTTQLKIREKLLKKHINVTPVMDRNYFHSIYFREPGGVLFEIATDPPGFLIDEDINSLGSNLKLPEWYESIRSEIENGLPPLKVPVSNNV
jgi:glyoxalase family protein